MININFAHPVDRLVETDTLVAFHHPKPTYPVHILLVPKRTIEDLEGISQQDAAFLLDVFQVVRILVARFGLGENGYRLIMNGGKFQLFPYLHFHLISGE